MGLIPQRDYFDKDIANSDNTNGYYIIEHDDFVYNPRKSSDAPYGPISRYAYSDAGIVSPLYLCFRAKGNVDTNFFEWYFHSSAWHRYIYMTGDSGARHDRVSIKDADFFSMPIRFPSAIEQKKIAAFLNTIERRITSQQLLIGSLKKYKRGLVFSVFHSDNPYGIKVEATPLTYLLKEYRNRETANLRVCSVAVTKSVVDQLEHLGRRFSASDTSHYGRVKPGDVVYTKSPTGDFPYGIIKQSWLQEDVAVSPLYGVYTPLSYETGYLIHTYFEQSNNANNYLRTLAQKGAKNTINITTTHFLDKSIPFPSSQADVKLLVGLFTRITDRIESGECKLSLLMQQRKTLMQQLFI